MSIPELYQTAFDQSNYNGPENLTKKEQFSRRPTAYSKHWWTELDLPWKDISRVLGCSYGNEDSAKDYILDNVVPVLVTNWSDGYDIRLIFPVIHLQVLQGLVQELPNNTRRYFCVRLNPDAWRSPGTAHFGLSIEAFQEPEKQGAVLTAIPSDRVGGTVNTNGHFTIGPKSPGDLYQKICAYKNLDPETCTKIFNLHKAYKVYSEHTFVQNTFVYHQKHLYPFVILKVNHYEGNLHPEPESAQATYQLGIDLPYRWVQYPSHLLTDSFPLAWFRGKTKEDIIEDTPTRSLDRTFPEYLPKDNRTGDHLYSIKAATLNLFLERAAERFDALPSAQLQEILTRQVDPTESPIYSNLISNIARELKLKHLEGDRLEVETCLSYSDFIAKTPDYQRWPRSLLWGNPYCSIPDFKTPSFGLLKGIYSDIIHQTILTADHLPPLCNLTRTASDLAWDG